MVGGMIVGGTTVGSTYYDTKFPSVGVSTSGREGVSIIPKTVQRMDSGLFTGIGVGMVPIMFSSLAAGVMERRGVDTGWTASGTATISIDPSKREVTVTNIIPKTIQRIGSGRQDREGIDLYPKTIQRIGVSIRQMKGVDTGWQASGTAVGVLGSSKSSRQGVDVFIIWKVEGVPDIIPTRDGQDIIVDILNKSDFPNTPVAILFAEDRFDLIEEVGITNLSQFTIEGIDPELDHKVAGVFVVQDEIDGVPEKVEGEHSYPRIIIGINKYLDS